MSQSGPAFLGQSIIVTPAMQGPPGPGKFLTSTYTWTNPNVNTSALWSTITFPFAGAILGNPAIVARSDGGTISTGTFLYAEVSSANTVTVAMMWWNSVPPAPTYSTLPLTVYVLQQG